jgi:3-oxoacyl-[acyl-carrier protein] reductase
MRVLLTGFGNPVGIAGGIARRLAAGGAELELAHWTPGADAVAEQEADALRASGAIVRLHRTDLADADQTVALVAAASERGPLDALVLSHAYSIDSDVFTTSVESFDRHHAINSRAAWLLIREFAASRPERVRSGARLDAGSIVALTSDHVAHNLAYGASKGSLDRVVLGAAGELGVRGIRANLINPGPIDTGWMDDAIRDSGTAAQPSGRLGTPEDIGDLVAWLVGPDSAWMTGQLLKHDGGFSTPG